MKPLTISSFTFSRLIEGGYQYVDKTALIHNLVREPFGQYFLSRPRRFGKSLLVSTLKAIFQGRRDLFAGLAIDSLKHDWPAHPVIHIDLGDRQANSPEQLEKLLCEVVDENAALHGLTLHLESAASRFRELVLALAQRSAEKVVILIDEYDKPILGHMEDPVKAQSMLPVLKNFYAVIKTTEPHQRFALLTGVGRFAKVSVFSDLNNLDDLTMKADFASLLGYTQKELEASFGDRIDALAAQENMSRGAMLAKIREWYNGYCFAKNEPTVYNPVSIANLFKDKCFQNYWFETGTPSFLIQLMKRERIDPETVSHQLLSAAAFSTFEIPQLRALPMLFQTGYLTLAKYDPRRDGYRLDYPNREVREAFSRCLLAGLSERAMDESVAHLFQLETDLEEGNIDGVFANLKVFFAKIPYDIQLDDEKYYQSIFHVIFTLLGYRIACEVRTNKGRIDAVLETAGRVLVFEFKLDGTAEEALAQIKRQNYHQRYLNGPKPVILIGAAFTAKSRNLNTWLVETAESM